MSELSITKHDRMERMMIACVLLTSIWNEVRDCEADDIESGLLQNAVYAQVDINRIVWKLNELNGCEPQTEFDWKQRLCDMYGADRKSFDEAWKKYEADKVEDEPQTEDGIMPEVKAEIRLDENNKTLWIKTDTIESFDRIITEDGSNWCRIFYEDCGECAHNKPRSNDEPQTDCNGCIYLHCNGECGEVDDEPQADCAWK